MTETLARPASRTLVLNAADNVAVALTNLDVGTDTPQGVKTAQARAQGAQVRDRADPDRRARCVKFGQIIGFATKDIPPGEWVHEHNCGIGAEHGAFERDYAFCEGVRAGRLRAARRSARPSRAFTAPTGRSGRATMSASSPR